MEGTNSALIRLLGQAVSKHVATVVDVRDVKKLSGAMKLASCTSIDRCCRLLGLFRVLPVRLQKYVTRQVLHCSVRGERRMACMQRHVRHEPSTPVKM
jgi:hypothetical protein